MLNIYYLFTLLFVLYMLKAIDSPLKLFQKLTITLASTTVSILMIDLVFFFSTRQQEIFIITLFTSFLIILIQAMKRFDHHQNTDFDLFFSKIFPHIFLIYLTSVFTLSMIHNFLPSLHASLQILLIFAIQILFIVFRNFISKYFKMQIHLFKLVGFYVISSLFVISFENQRDIPITSSNRHEFELISNMISLENIFIEPLDEDISILSVEIYNDYLYYVVLRNPAKHIQPKYELFAYNFLTNQHEVIHTFYIWEDFYYKERFGMYELNLFNGYVYLVGPNGLFVLEENQVTQLYEIDRAQYQRYLIDYDYALYVEEGKLIYEAHAKSYIVNEMNMNSIDHVKAHHQYNLFSAHLKLYYLEVYPLSPYIDKIMDQNLNIVIENYPINLRLSDLAILTAPHPSKSFYQVNHFNASLANHFIETVVPENSFWMTKDVFIIESQNKKAQLELRTSIYHLFADQEAQLYILYRAYNKETRFAKINIHHNVLNLSDFMFIKTPYVMLIIILLPVATHQRKTLIQNETE
jgi:hypothetical protein